MSMIVSLCGGSCDGQVESFFAKLTATEIGVEACVGSHHWGRKCGVMGHRVRLIPRQYVKPLGQARQERSQRR